MKCERCGKDIPESLNYCPTCLVNGKINIRTITTETIDKFDSSVNEDSLVQKIYTKSKRNLIIYLLLFMTFLISLYFTRTLFIFSFVTAILTAGAILPVFFPFIIVLICFLIIYIVMIPIISINQIIYINKLQKSIKIEEYLRKGLSKSTIINYIILLMTVFVIILTFILYKSFI